MTLYDSMKQPDAGAKPLTPGLYMVFNGTPALIGILKSIVTSSSSCKKLLNSLLISSVL